MCQVWDAYYTSSSIEQVFMSREQEFNATWNQILKKFTRVKWLYPVDIITSQSYNRR